MKQKDIFSPFVCKDPQTATPEAEAYMWLETDDYRKIFTVFFFFKYEMKIMKLFSMKIKSVAKIIIKILKYVLNL